MKFQNSEHLQVKLEDHSKKIKSNTLKLQRIELALKEAAAQLGPVGFFNHHFNGKDLSEFGEIRAILNDVGKALSMSEKDIEINR